MGLSVPVKDWSGPECLAREQPWTGTPGLISRLGYSDIGGELVSPGVTLFCQGAGGDLQPCLVGHGGPRVLSGYFGVFDTPKDRNR